MKSLVGRPRRITDAQIKTILEWHKALLAWRAQGRSLKTMKQLARELGIAKSSITDVIKNRGQFKQASPQQHLLALEARRARIQNERGRGKRGRPPKR